MNRFYSLSLLVVLSACANVTTNKIATTQKASTEIAQNGTTSPTPLTQAAIQGNWASGCTTSSSGAFYTTDLLIEDAVTYVTTISYSDSLCKTPITEEDQISDFTLTAMTNNDFKLVETPHSITYKALTAAQATVLNNMKPSADVTGFCGKTTWQSNELKAFVDPTVCGLNSTFQYKADLYSNANSAELDLDDCLTDDTSTCNVIRLTPKAL